MAESSGDVPPGAIIRQIGNLMTRGCGPLRTAGSLRGALRDLEDAESKLPRMRVGGSGGMLAALEANSMALVARAVLLAARSREESRAEHYRADFAARDDKRWARNLVAGLDKDGAVKVAPSEPRA
jgi:succinate dehydrogenase/fumarate reductase flavoprotein subunit